MAEAAAAETADLEPIRQQHLKLGAAVTADLEQRREDALASGDEAAVRLPGGALQRAATVLTPTYYRARPAVYAVC